MIDRRTVSVWVCLVALAAGRGQAADAPLAAEWGTAAPHPRLPGVLLLTVKSWPESGKLTLPETFPRLLRAAAIDRPALTLDFELSTAALRLHLPPERPAGAGPHLIVETAASSGQLADGRIVFLPADAERGGRLQLVKSPSEQLESWDGAETIASWNHEATRPGRYAIEASYALPAGAAEVECALGMQRLTARLEATGESYSSVVVGNLSIAGPGKQTLRLRPIEGAARLKLRSLQLRPISEGQPIVQDKNTGVVMCHAKDVVIHGVKVQWEPKPEKQTVGFWVNASDWISWEFRVSAPGEFDVEILQGCGKGHGGSEVELTVAGTPLKFVVEDTGHFQNFVPRTIGRVRIAEAGAQEIVVRPLTKKSVAVMDLRQVRLIPVKPE